tara:strand:+ start:320 stop:1264 length:945 start_codon:yes stop_codon:yes gene_type:complete
MKLHIKSRDKKIYVVMYHYIREVKKSRYPDLKALEYKDFKKQINFFKKNYNILDQNDLCEIVNSKKIPNKPSILLTFDDGYADHFKYVFPILSKNRISGCFYPSIKALKQREVLDVNKIQFILEKEKNRKKILDIIEKILIKSTGKNLEKFYFKIKQWDRFDDKKTFFIKQLLQYLLPLKIRKYIVNNLFEEIVDVDEKEFANNLYMSPKNIKEMYSNKLSIGLHGTNHIWLKYTSKNEQEKEIKNSINFFSKLDIDKNNLSMAYPYGSYNSITLNLLKKYGIKFAFTTKPGGITNQNIMNKYLFPRYDTNDFK